MRKHALLAVVDRELVERRNTYPLRVSAGFMRQVQAAQGIAEMQAVRDALVRYVPEDTVPAPAPQTKLF